MGGYADYNMNESESGETVAGICHPKGPNAGLTPQWLVYIAVANVAQSIKKRLELGGQMVGGPHILDGSQFYVFQDTAAGGTRINQPVKILLGPARVV
jgi:predicted enzyme related to lactoylglutathione lyase